MDLETRLEKAFRLTPTQKKALTRLGIGTVHDLLFHFPSRYGSPLAIKRIADLTEGDEAIVYGKVTNAKTSKAYRMKIPLAEATVKDDTGKIKAVWFRQAYIAKMLADEPLVKLKGRVARRGSSLYLANPEVEKTKTLPIDFADSLFVRENGEPDEDFLYPIYPESRGITSRWFYHHIHDLLTTDILDHIEDPIPSEILERYHLPGLKTALVFIHSPKKESDAEAARKRFAFQEVFFIQLSRIGARKRYEQERSFIVNADKNDIADFIKRFGFELTDAQKNAIDRILDDFRSGKPMLRLLEGDVGSGKTAVAATTAYAIIKTPPQEQDFGTLQVAYMAPTEILAKQHFASFIEYFAHTGINIGLITGSGCYKYPSKVDAGKPTNISRTQLLKWVANGEIAILIGTHALIQKSVTFKHLAYVIVDEQHRFGTKQRMQLTKKDVIAPHFLSMTATPIPRTLALTIFGDLDLTLLDEMPRGRKQIITEIVPPAKRDGAYEAVRNELADGRQLYVICPRIDEPDPHKESALNAKSVKAEAKRLKKDVFKEYEIDILHGKMTPKEQQAVMSDFSDKKINILVATSVIEVGVNIPNATIIVIEGAERFGLAQLHQLRGRVLRSEHQAYCYIFSGSDNEKSMKRLAALASAKNGFELSEIDLTLRGAGSLSGKKQWGISDIGMEAIRNIKMVEAARAEAEQMLNEDPALTKHSSLKARITTIDKNAHFE